MHISWSPCRVENPEQHQIHPLNVSVSEWGPQGYFIYNNARFDVNGSCSGSISWRNGGLSGFVTQIHYANGESPPHTVHWRLILPFLPPRIWALSYSHVSSRYWMNATYIKTLDTMLCTTHPYKFLLTTNMTVESCNQSYCVTAVNPMYTSCIAPENITERNFTYPLPLCQHAELWIPVTLT